MADACSDKREGIADELDRRISMYAPRDAALLPGDGMRELLIEARDALRSHGAAPECPTCKGMGYVQVRSPTDQDDGMERCPEECAPSTGALIDTLPDAPVTFDLSRDVTARSSTAQRPEEGSMEEFAEACQFMQKIVSAKTNGDAVGHLLSYRKLIRERAAVPSATGKTIYAQTVKTLVGNATARVRFVSRQNIKDKPTEANPSPIRVLLVGELPNAEATAQGGSLDGTAKP